MHFHPCRAEAVRRRMHLFVLMLLIVLMLMPKVIVVNRRYLRRWMLRVGRSAFLLIHRHEFHPAFRTIPRMIGYDFRMHETGVLLLRLLFVIVIVTRAIEVNRPYLTARCERDQHKCARDYN